MPRIPTAGTTTGRIGFAPIAQPERISALGQSVAGVIGQGAGLALDLHTRETDAKRKHEEAVGVASLTGRIGARQIEAENDPQINGSAARFREGVDEDLRQHLESVDDPRVAEAISNRVIQMSAATGVSVDRTERSRFNANAVVTIGNLTDNYIAATASASNVEVEQQNSEAFHAAISQSDFLTPAQKDGFVDQFNVGVSTTQALQDIEADPDAFGSVISDPSNYPGLTPQFRIKLTLQALQAGEIEERRGNAQAKRDLTQSQNNNTRDVIARFIDGEDPTVIQADVLEDTSRFSVTGLNTIKTALSAAAVVVDDREQVIQIQQAIERGESTVGDDIDSAYVGLSLTLSTKNSLEAQNARQNEAKSSPVRRAYDLIARGLGPGPNDQFAERQESAIRQSLGLEELEIFLANSNPSPTKIRQKAREILRAFPGGEGVAAAGVARLPFGITKPLAKVTPSDLETSDKAIGRALNTGQMSDDMAMFLIRNNEILLPDARTRQVVLDSAKDGD